MQEFVVIVAMAYNAESITPEVYDRLISELQSNPRSISRYQLGQLNKYRGKQKLGRPLYVDRQGKVQVERGLIVGSKPTAPQEQTEVIQDGVRYTYDERGTFQKDVSRPAGTVVEQGGYTYQYQPGGGFVTVKRPEAVEKRRQFELKLISKANKGEKITAGELAYDNKNIEFTSTTAAVASTTAQKQIEQENLRRQQEAKRQEESAMTLSGFLPVATSTQGQTIYQTQEGLQTAQQRQIGSNVFTYDFSSLRAGPVQQKRQGIFTDITTYGSREIPRKIEQAQTAIDAATYSRDVTFKVLPLAPQTKTKRETVIVGVVSPKKFDSFGKVAVGIKGFQSIGKIYSPLQEALVQKSPLFGPIINTGVSFSNYLFAGGQKLVGNVPYLGTAYSATRNVAQPFITGAIRDPLLTAATVVAPQRLLGKTAYKALDVLDVAGSVVSESFKGYVTGGVRGAAAGAVGGFAGEKLSDFGAGYTKPFGKGYTITGTQSITTKSRKVTRTPTIQLNQLPISTSKAVGTGRTYEVVAPARYVSTSRTKTEGGLLVRRYFKIAARPVDTKTSTEGVFYPTEESPTKVIYTQTRIVNIASTNRGLFRGSKRGSMALLTGSQTGDYAGTGGIGSGNYQGTLTPTTEPNARIKELLKPVSVTRPQTTSRLTTRTVTRTKTPRPRLFSRLQTPNLSFSVSGPKSRYSYLTLGQTRIGSRPQTRNLSSTLSVSRNLSASISPTTSLTQSNTNTVTNSVFMSQSISQTITQTISPTSTFTQTQTRTPTVTTTFTMTPTTTLTPTLSKLTGGKRKSLFGKRKKLSLKPNYKYSPTAYAAGLSIYGKRLKGTLSGLEFRGLVR